MRPLAPELVGVLVVAHALPRFLGYLSIYDSWVLNLGCPCPKKRYRSKLVTYDSRQYVLGTDGALITGTIELHADETGAVHYTPRGE